MSTDRQLLNDADDLRRSGHLTRAETLYRESIAKTPTDARAYFGLGQVVVDQDRNIDAEAPFLKALQFIEEDEKDRRFAVYMSLGRVYRRLGRWQDALTSYDSAIELNPRSTEAHQCRGDAQRQCGHLVDALASYERAMAPLQPLARARARALAAIGDKAAAMESQAKARDVRPRRAIPWQTMIDTRALGTGHRRSGDSCSVALISGDRLADTPTVDIYLRSLAQVFHGDKHILAHGLSQASTDRLIRLGFHVTPVIGPLSYLARDRWLVYLSFLRATSYATCLVSDSRDIIFRSNPFDYALGQDQLTLVSDGEIHDRLPWNMDQQQGLLSSLCLDADCADWEVINASVQYGSVDRMKALCVLMYSNLLLSNPDSLDQAMLNYLYYTVLAGDPHYVVLTPASSTFFLSAGQRATGRSAARADASPRGVERFTIIHQWDRLSVNEVVEP